MIKTIIRTVGAITAGLIVVSIFVVAVELFCVAVHPYPEDFDGSLQAMREHVKRSPSWVLGVGAIGWGVTALAGTWTAGRLGDRTSASFVGLLLVAAVIFNLTQVPYPIWFEIVVLTAIPLAGVCGLRLSSCAQSNLKQDPS